MHPTSWKDWSDNVDFPFRLLCVIFTIESHLRKTLHSTSQNVTNVNTDSILTASEEVDTNVDVDTSIKFYSCMALSENRIQ